MAIVPELFATAAFFSIGSNDLTQYVTAAARDSAAVAASTTCAIRPSCASSRRSPASARARAWTSSLCGDVASDPALVPLLLKLGLAQPVGRAGGARRASRRRSPRSVSGTPMLDDAGRPGEVGSADGVGRIQGDPAARARHAPVRHAPAPCRGARQEPQLRLADHQPGLRHADPGAAPRDRSSRSATSRRTSATLSSPPTAAPIRAGRCRRRTRRACARTPSICPTSATPERNQQMDALVGDFVQKLDRADRAKE